MKKILLIATGGTIASKKTDEGLAPVIYSEELLSHVPEINTMCEVDTTQVLNIDSTNLQPEYWSVIIEAIRKDYEKYDGFVITHGTDTMSYTAAALSYMIQNLDKPVIITGSQKSISEVATDARKNILDSFRFALEDGVKGVYVVFDGKAIVGTRARKVRTKSYNAFESINFPYAAYIENKRIAKIMSTDRVEKPVKFYEEIYPKIFLLKLVPGMDPDVLDYIGETYEGVVIESYGSGGIPFNDKRNFTEKLGNLTDKGKTVVIATQVSFEGSDMGLYEVGIKTLNNYPVLQAFDMTVEAAVTKLMWILAQTKEPSKIKELFYTRINDDILAD